MTSVAMTGTAPYKTVITHGFVVDKDTRKKVSKSAQGTYAKPMDAQHFVGTYGADIVRLWGLPTKCRSPKRASRCSLRRIAASGISCASCWQTRRDALLRVPIPPV